MLLLVDLQPLDWQPLDWQPLMTTHYSQHLHHCFVTVAQAPYSNFAAAVVVAVVVMVILLREHWLRSYFAVAVSPGFDPPLAKHSLQSSCQDLAEHARHSALEISQHSRRNFQLAQAPPAQQPLDSAANVLAHAPVLGLEPGPGLVLALVPALTVAVGAA